MRLLLPDKFIPLAEDTGMIVQLDRLVMKTAIKQFKIWHAEDLHPGKLSLNLAIKQMEESDCIEFILTMLKDQECLAKHISFEVTESQIMKDPEQSIDVLEKISAMGIELAVDDFGTGYSSLTYLKRLPINRLKIDRSFIRDIHLDEEDVTIIKTIINLAKNLNLDVIAEGVETQEQSEFLQLNGCVNIQGYLFSKPLSAEDMSHFLQTYKREMDL